MRVPDTLRTWFGVKNRVRFIPTSGLVSIDAYREIVVVTGNSASTLTFLATNGVYGNAPNSQYPAQWYIAGSNDLSTWTQILDQRHTSPSNYNTQKTVNVSGYKYLKFGSGNAGMNYYEITRFENMVWS